MTSLWWVRRDARLADNPALLDAQAEGAAAAVFAWTPALHRWSGRRSAHLARVLWSLREDTNGALGVRRGVAADVVLAAAREHGSAVVHAAREFTPSGIREQDSVGAALAADGRELRLTRLAVRGAARPGDEGRWQRIPGIHALSCARGATTAGHRPRAAPNPTRWSPQRRTSALTSTRRTATQRICSATGWSSGRAGGSIG